MRINPDTVNIDKVSTLEMVRKFNSEDKKVAEAVEGCLEAVAAAVDIMACALSKGGRVIYIGSGTSGKLAVVDASECPPTFGVDDNMIIGIISGGVEAVYGWKEETEDDEELAVKDLRARNLNSGDVIVGISASGNTPYVLSGLKFGSSIGCKTIGISCSNIGKLNGFADVNIVADVGPEVIEGSTRLKAGTAQKMILNMLSSCTMIKLGKTYGNLMVNVKPINLKLKKRIIEIIMYAASCRKEAAVEALEKAGGNAKVAITMLINGIDAEKAEELARKNEHKAQKAVEGD
ncbi:MAG: N-acetylmuramic acid 6-phosphate etherase [Caulobacteraceae bacterium]